MFYSQFYVMEFEKSIRSNTKILYYANYMLFSQISNNGVENPPQNRNRIYKSLVKIR